MQHKLMNKVKAKLPNCDVNYNDVVDVGTFLSSKKKQDYLDVSLCI